MKMVREIPMGILTAVIIELPCNVCGGRFPVTLRQVLLSQEILRHEGGPFPEGAAECPPVAYQGFLLTTDLELDAPASAWVPPNSGLLSSRTRLRRVGMTGASAE
jgi:hypothetical protein